MRILGIFDYEEIDSIADSIRKQKHFFEQVSSCEEGVERLGRQKFDLILCQEYFENETQTVFEFLKELRHSKVQADIPFICCRIHDSEVAAETLDRVYSSTLSILGGQGFIDKETFQSRRLMSTIEKCLQQAVGGDCNVERF